MRRFEHLQLTLIRLPRRRFIRYADPLKMPLGEVRRRWIPWAALQQHKTFCGPLNPNVPDDSPVSDSGDTLLSRYETLMVLVVLLMLVLLFLVIDVDWTVGFPN